MNKVIKILISIIILVIIMIPGVEAVVSPTSDFYVNDYANILNSETKQYIMNTNIKLHDYTKAQVCVVTVESLEGKTVEEYATETFRSFGIGDKEKNNGVLLIVSTGDRKIRIEVGYGLEGRLTDARTGAILDAYAVPYLKDNNWNEGIKNTFNAIISDIEKEYDLDLGAEKPIGNLEEDNDEISTIMAAIVLAVFLFLIVWSMKHGGGGYYGGGHYYGGGGGWSSGGGRRRLLWRRWFIRWWWIIKIVLIGVTNENKKNYFINFFNNNSNGTRCRSCSKSYI